MDRATSGNGIDAAGDRHRQRFKKKLKKKGRRETLVVVLRRSNNTTDNNNNSKQHSICHEILTKSSCYLLR